MFVRSSRIGPAVLAVSVALCMQPARAADYPTNAPPVYAAPPAYEPAPPKEPPPHDWGGCYAGGSIGGELTTMNYKTLGTPYGLSPYAPASNQNDKWIAGLVGAQVGCNHVFGKPLVGVEFDVWYSPSPDPEYCGSLIDPIIDCVRPKDRPGFSGAIRFGMIEKGFLFYGKLGVSYQKTDFEMRYHRTKPKGNTPTQSEPFQYEEINTREGSISQTGLLIGFGVEYALDEVWTTKLEVNSIVTGESKFGSVIKSGSICDNNNTDAPMESCSSGSTLNTTGMVARQSVKFGRTILKVGLNRKF